MKVSKSYRSRMYAIVGTEEEVTEALLWCEEAFGPPGVGGGWRLSTISHGAMLIFDNDSYNSLFKLRWWNDREDE